MSDYLFSQFQAQEFAALRQELSTVFDISQCKLQSLYEVMQQEFELEGYPEHTLPRNIFHSHNASFQNRYKEALVIVVDIPSILEKDNNILNKKTVAIIGQDPLRKSNKRVEEISIATPYALHLKNCRKKLRNTKFYFELIQVLLDEGYRVYLTDICKVFVSKEDCDRRLPLTKQDYTRFIQVLKAELDIFKPIAVITWGREAMIGVSRIKLQHKHLVFPHPSGAARGAWRKLMGKPATRENCMNFWRETVFAELSDL
ncbi:uracil-DNA glycosylase family protein [Aliinostoc sp. HNIBRCY26]|uniref:uracil-DNA glycosylase family protein n=1 Tax=Aliinostoc sp. HNIBRCY26 TaxID=3418997 RepID=UPI003D030D61